MNQRSKKLRPLDDSDSGGCKITNPKEVDGVASSEKPLFFSLSYWRHDIRAAAVVCVLLLLAVLLVFGRTVHYEFIDFDDNLYVYENPQVTRGLTAHGVVWAFTAYYANNWHPVTWLTHMLDVQIYGLNPGGHHLTNVLLHAASAVLLFVLLWRMTGFLWRSAFVAAVFALHPLRAESVAWVSERKDVLSGLFFMLTIWAYMGYARRPFSWARYGTVMGLFSLGLMSKPMLVTLPFVLLLLDYWPLGRMALPEPAAGRMMDPRSIPDCLRKNRRPVVEKIPLIVLAAASCIATYIAQSRIVVPLDVIPVSSRIANAIVSYMAYIGKLFYPIGLAVFYPHPEGGLPAWQIVASILALTGISVGVILWRRRFPYLFVGWFWYVGMLVPVIGLVQVGSQSMADRYTYLPQIGLVLAVTWGIGQWTSSWRHRVWICSIVSVILVFILMGLSWRQVSYWQNRETLWSHALDCTENNYFVHDALGDVLAERGEVDAAIGHYRKAMEIQPHYAAAYNNLGRLLAGLGQVDAAITLFQKSLQIQRYDAEPHYNLGLALKNRGEIDAAIFHYRKALELRPDYASAHNNLGNTLAGIGRIDEAIEHFRKALESKPEDPEIQNNLGIAMAQYGQIDAAIVHFQKALKLKPDDEQIRSNLNRALMQREQTD